MQKEIMNVPELAEYIGVSGSKIYKLIRDKKIPASKIGRQYKFSKQVIDSWLKENIITSFLNEPLFQPKKNVEKGGEKNGKEESSEEKSCEKESSEENGEESR
ncbi:helix-turn-helix domain-containing protein [bacterium]|nr:helix-turn-helix domain-containing protein [bacterium]MBU4133780.1 helix-turn-helix domain-containing protein [bacterium]